ncbi:MAG: peptide chain release factor-like protein [Candidatus Paceibacterota bacterium]
MNEVKTEYVLSRGPGGQRRDKKKTGIRLRHAPSGIVVQVDDQRSQSQNKKIAFQILAGKLKKIRQRKKKRIPTKAPRWAKETRLENKKQRSVKKELRRQI